MNYNKQLSDMDLRKKKPLIHHGAYVITMGALFAITLTMVSINNASAPSFVANIDRLQQTDRSSAAQKTNVARSFKAENIRPKEIFRLSNNAELVFNIVPAKESAIVNDIYLNFFATATNANPKPLNVLITNKQRPGNEVSYQDQSQWTDGQVLQSPSIKNIVDTNLNRVILTIKTQRNSDIRIITQAELVINYQE